ncbi:MAG TPA: ArsA family ATPase [Vicinamibacterales bacterium]
MPSSFARFTFFAGKGGVGKTTCAAARAVAAAAGRRRVLAVSTDPAHSLGDALGARLRARPQRVRLAGRAGSSGTLHAAEIDARRAFARWLKTREQALGDIVEHGTWLDRQDVDALLGLSIPGIDELVGLREVIRLAENDEYDEVVVDTAPTGHTLRLVAAPETVATLAHALDALQEEHRLIRDQLARVGRPEPSDRLIELLTREARDTSALLRDPRRVAFNWVTLPEEMSLAEAEDGIGALERSGIRVGSVIVNRAVPDGPPCPICDRRRASEGLVIDRIRRRLGRKRTLHVVPAQRIEPRGVAALRRIGQALSSPDLDLWGPPSGGPIRLQPPSLGPIRLKPPSLGPIRLKPDPTNAVLSLRKEATTTSPESLEVFRDTQLLFFGGKGGVGKTTVAATVALRLARAEPRRAVLLLSTDPAHSLGDVFGQPIGDKAARIRGGPGNLHVRELDAAAALASRRAGLEAALNEIGAAIGAGGLAAGGRGAAELMELAPPGIDELFGLVSVVEARDRFPLIVMDTAPTGHALRLLEMPDAAREWVQVLLRVLLKYRSLVRPGQLASELVDLSKSIRGLQELLRNPRDTRFVVVTRAAAVPRLETERLLVRLRRLRLASPAVVVNAMTLAPGRCPLCRATEAAERRELALLARRTRRCAIIQTPLAAPPPRGAAALDRWAGSWIVKERRTPRQARGALSRSKGRDR